MKKTYVKPRIMFESFSLSQSISAGCEITNPHDDRLAFTGAGVGGGVGYVFADENACDVYMDDDGSWGTQWGGICYHVFTDLEEVLNVFDS